MYNNQFIVEANLFLPRWDRKMCRIKENSGLYSGFQLYDARWDRKFVSD